MIIPVYCYVIFTLLMEFINLQSELSVVYQDIVNIVGTTIITAVTIYYIYIIKFINILFMSAEDYNSSYNMLKNFSNFATSTNNMILN